MGDKVEVVILDRAVQCSVLAYTTTKLGIIS
jgi:hypothetical protein